MSGFLLDTHTLLWAMSEPDTLGRKTRKILEAPGSDLFVSSVSPWEIAIKLSIGKLQLATHWARAISRFMAKNSINWQSITLQDSVAVSELPFHHRDPFDRLLVAQAQVRGQTILSRDRQLDAYGKLRLW